MNSPAPASDLMSLDDFEDLLADQPDDERWELISGRLVRMMVGARWEHNIIVGNLASERPVPHHGIALPRPD